MKTLTLLVAATALSLNAAPGTPAITQTAYDAVNHVMTVTYTLPGSEDAIVTMSATYGGATVDPNAVVGDINAKLSPGEHVAYWNVKDTFPAASGSLDSLVVKLTAWSLTTPPNYMAVLLGNPATVRYYASAEAVPGGVGSDRWKENWLLMRKIPAKNVTWRMGCASTDYCWGAGEQTGENATRYGFQELKYVTTTNDFYIGVYEFTQGQYRTLMNALPSLGGVAAFSALPNASHFKIHWKDWKWHPVESVTWANATNAMGRIAAANGLDFALPSPTEWEFAARGETQWGTYNGAPYTPTVLSPIAVNFQAQEAYYGGAKDVAHPYYAYHMPVGQKRPNKYGLYDMVGNVAEWCADREDEAAGVHPTKGGVLSMSGEGFGVGYTCAVATHVGNESWMTLYQGFRACCRIPDSGMVK